MTDARYARQTVLAEIGEMGQKALADTRILIIGLGGLGCPAALYLAAAGIGKLGLIDADRVSVSNLQRQILFQESDAGGLKVDAGRKRLLALNPTIAIDVYPHFFDETIALAIAASYDILLDGSDNFATKELVNAVACRLRKPLIYGSVLRFEGRVSLFWPGRGPCYRCLFPDRPERHLPNCAEAGVVGAMAGTVGSLQALEAIKAALTLKSDRPLEGLLGKLLVLGPSGIRTLTVPRDPDCPVCSREEGAIELPKLQMLCARNELTTRELRARRDDFVLVDVRESAEWDRGYIAGAVHWPLSRLIEGDLPLHLKDAENRSLLLYCQSGMRSQHALRILHAKGWQALHLVGGYSYYLQESRAL